MKKFMLPVCAAALAASIFCSCAPLQVAEKVLDESDLKDKTQAVGQELAQEAPAVQTASAPLSGDLVRQNYTTDQPITQIDIEEVDANLEIRSGTTQEIQVSYVEPSNRSLYTFEVRGSTLKIKKTGRVNWENNSTPATVITLPDQEYQSIEIEGTNLYLTMSDLDVVQLDAEADNGYYEVSGLQARNASFSADNGSAALTDLTAQKLDVEMDNGTLELNRTLVDHYECEMDNGQISGTVTGSEEEYNTRISIGGVLKSNDNRNASKTMRFELDHGDVQVDFQL